MLDVAFLVVCTFIATVLCYRAPKRYQAFVATFPCLVYLFVSSSIGHGFLVVTIAYIPILVAHFVCLMIERKHHDALTRAVILVSFLIVFAIYPYIPQLLKAVTA